MKNRIFWLGMHKVLLQTELPRLRHLGFEVYNPPYLSDVYDQSAVYDWEGSQGSTLPPDVQKLLSETNFFYDGVRDEVAGVLNEYFDAIIVTINPLWLLNILKSYNGKIIYRTYGQPYSLSQELIDNGAFKLIVERENFWFCPHSEKVIGFEDDWLRARMKIVPYCLTEDVITLRDTWTLEGSEANVGMLCPRAMDIPYYAEQYKFIKQNFPDLAFKVFGAQNVAISDPRVIGTLQRDAFLQRLGRMRAFVYHYKEPTVCYLPPIEFMTLGGPVIFQGGSLLSRYFPNDTLGRAKTTQELVSLSERLRVGDATLSSEIIDSQKAVRTLYQPEHVWPIFDQAMREMLGSEGDNPGQTLFYDSSSPPVNGSIADAMSRSGEQERRILIPFHGFGPLIVRHDGQYHCAEGIARVVRQFVRALTDERFTAIVTSHDRDVARVYGFFASGVEDVTRLKILTIDAAKDSDNKGSGNAILRRVTQARGAIFRRAKTIPVAAYHRRFKNLLKSGAYSSLLKSLAAYTTVVFAKIALRVTAKLKTLRLPKPSAFDGYVDRLNSDTTISDVLIPHYHMFPELRALVDKRVILYLPDYLPHFYRGSAEMGASRVNEEIGRQLSDKAEWVVTNSAFTKEYLPSTGLNIAAEKIVHIPLPFLHETLVGQEESTSAVEVLLPEHFVFYPTRDRPSKRLKDFVTTVELANKRLEGMGRSERIHGVVTTRLSGSITKAAKPYITVLEDLSDRELAVVYKKSLCLLFTSEMEGNFPTQITEALNLRVPVVASDMPLVVAELGDVADSLDLQRLGDVNGYVDRVLDVLDNRSSAIQKQAAAREFALENFAYEKFRDRFCEIFVHSPN